MELDMGKNIDAPSFEQAVKVGLMVGPLSGAIERVHSNLVDFCARKFQAAISETPEATTMLSKLWYEIFEIELREVIVKDGKETKAGGDLESISAQPQDGLT